MISRHVARASNGEDATLAIHGEPPNFQALGDAAKFYDEQANIVEETLQHLPGGVYDRVLGIMMEHKACLLRVRHEFTFMPMRIADLEVELGKAHAIEVADFKRAEEQADRIAALETELAAMKENRNDPE